MPQRVRVGTTLGVRGGYVPASIVRVHGRTWRSVRRRGRPLKRGPNCTPPGAAVGTTGLRRSPAFGRYDPSGRIRLLAPSGPSTQTRRRTRQRPATVVGSRLGTCPTL